MDVLLRRCADGRDRAADRRAPGPRRHDRVAHGPDRIPLRSDRTDNADWTASTAERGEIRRSMHMKKYLFLVTLILAVAATCAADTTIYVTGNCAVTVANAPTPIPVATATPAPVITATPAPVVTATPTLTPSASSTLTPAQGYAQVLSIMVARFPKYDDTGALLPSQYYSFGTVMAPVQNALRAGQTPAKIAAALGTIWSRYATL